MIQLMIVGNLTADPAVRTVKTGTGDTNVCSYTVASNRMVHGEKQATFIRVTTCGRRAETDFQYLKKGSKVCVCADDIKAESYTNKDGVQRVSLEVTGNSVEYLGLAPGGNTAPALKDEQTGMMIASDEDLPF